MRIINIEKEIEKGKNLPSFHIFSGKYLRGQIIYFNSGKIRGDYQLQDENLLIIVIEGKINIRINKQESELNKNMQVSIKEGEVFSLKILKDSILEFIWSPGLYQI